jgi:uncharacterized membrane protein
MPVSQRADRLDALRGFAMLWMALFHASFDLNQAGKFTPAQDFYQDPFWTVQRAVIVSLFLACAGAAQALARAQQQPARRFWRRWLQIATSAVLVSLVSRWMFPGSWISFGVLHGIAAMLLVLRFAGGLPSLLLAAAGLLAALLPLRVQSEIFDSRWSNWLGLVTHKPVTEDYVPLLPWLAAMLWGYCAGRGLLRYPALLRGALPAPLQPLSLLGRWPLCFYLLHQPVLLGALMLWNSW